MRFIRSWVLRRRLQRAADLHRQARATEVEYSAYATKLLSQLAGDELEIGDNFSSVQTMVTGLQQLPGDHSTSEGIEQSQKVYGPFSATSLVLTNYTGGSTWTSKLEGLYRQLDKKVRRQPAAFDSWYVDLRKRYPVLVRASEWFAAILIGGLAALLIGGLLRATLF